MAQNEIAIDVNNITKSFKVFLDKGSQLKERLLFRKRSRYERERSSRASAFR